MIEQSGLLHGIRVIDLTRVLAGPYCTMLLGDLGADVIKVEAPGQGDDTRQWGPPFTESGESAYFLSANRNKRSMTLNLKTDEGIAILKDLIRNGDVLVENFKPRTLERWGLDAECLRELKPDLIYATITGYGYTGPYSPRPGYDFIVQAMGGFMSVTGPVEGEPTRAGIAIADLSAGIFACSAILAALFARERSGEGQRIDISLMDAQIALMSYVASNYLTSGEIPGRYGNGHPNIVPYQTFQAKDGYFAFAAGNDSQWEKFCQAVGKTQWIQDERSKTNAARVENRLYIVNKLNQLFAARDTRDWLDLLNEIGLPCGPINSLDKVFTDPQTISRDMLIHCNHDTAGIIPLVGSPFKIPTNPVKVVYPPPTLGQNTEEILMEVLSYSKEQIDRWRDLSIL